MGATATPSPIVAATTTSPASVTSTSSSEISSLTNVSFGSPAFSFSLSSQNAAPNLSSNAFNPNNSGIPKLSETKEFGFVFTKQPQSSATIQASTATTATAHADGVEDVSDDENVLEEESTAHFEPLVTLPKVEVKTGEEEETVLYSHRAKLYRYRNGEWRERGLGDVKILRHEANGKLR